MGFLLAACTGLSANGQVCTSDAPASALAGVPGVDVSSSVEIAAEGVGNVVKRQFVLTGDGTEMALRDRVVDALSQQGWKPTRCVTTAESCLRNDTYFVSLVAGSDLATPGLPLAYPTAVAGGGPQVMAALAPNTCH
jgi:hypothetical protein